jgi:hypothetical protein
MNGQYQIPGILTMISQIIKCHVFIKIPGTWYCPGLVNEALLQRRSSETGAHSNSIHLFIK